MFTGIKRQLPTCLKMKLLKNLHSKNIDKNTVTLNVRLIYLLSSVWTFQTTIRR